MIRVYPAIVLIILYPRPHVGYGKKGLGSTMQNATSVTRPRVISTTEKGSLHNLPTRLQHHSVSKSYDERSVDNSRGSILGDRETLDSAKTLPRSTEPITPSDMNKSSYIFLTPYSSTTLTTNL